MSGRETVIEVGCVVCDLVGQVDDLSFERGPLARTIFIELRKFSAFEVARVFDDSFAHLKSQIQTGKTGISLLEVLHDAQRMKIVIESVAELLHLAVKLFFSGMRKGRMADIVREGQRLGQVFIQSERRCDRPGDLRDLDRMRKPVAEMVVQAGGEDLRLVLQTAKCAGVDDAIAVALEIVAVRVGEARDNAGPAIARQETEGSTGRAGSHSELYRADISPSAVMRRAADRTPLGT